MATILNRQVTFSTNGTVTAAGLHNLIDETEIYAGIITTQPVITSVGSSDQLLIADADLTPTAAPRRVTVGSMFNDALNNGIYTSSSFTGTITAGSFVGPLNGSVNGTIVGTGGTISSLTTGTTTSTAQVVTGGTITTLNSTTGTITNLNSTSGTVATLNSTTGTIGTINSTTGTIENLSATTSTFLGTITGSTNVINIGSGQIYKAANGNVTIGTNDAGDSLRYLDVQNTNSSANAGAILRLITSNAAGSGNIAVDIVKYKTGGFTISNGETSAAAFTSFNVGTAERMRIDSGGVLYVNKTATNTASQAIISGGTANALEGETSSSASYPFLAINTATSGSNRFVYFGTEAGGSSIRGFIDYNRGSNVTRYSTTSDARLKNVIGDSSGEESVSILKNTKIRDYTWKEDQFAKVNVGVIAQELYGVFKGAVSIGNEIVRKDENGNNVIVEEPWGVDKTAFTFHLISGWQTHEKLIQELKAENNSLKSRIEALEAK